MKPSLLSVLNKMRTNKRKGISFDDFPRGKDLRKRISELKYMGYNIHKIMEPISTGHRARYFLIAEPKQ